MKYYGKSQKIMFHHLNHPCFVDYQLIPKQELSYKYKMLIGQSKLVKLYALIVLYLISILRSKDGSRNMILNGSATIIFMLTIYK